MLLGTGALLFKKNTKVTGTGIPTMTTDMALQSTLFGNISCELLYQTIHVRVSQRVFTNFEKVRCKFSHSRRIWHAHWDIIVGHIIISTTKGYFC